MTFHQPRSQPHLLMPGCRCCAAILLTTIAIVVSPASAAAQAGGLAGRITAADSGTALDGVPVEVISQPTAGVAATTATSSDGTYEVSGLAPGLYYVRTTLGSNSEYIDEIYDDQQCLQTCLTGFRTPVIVSAGEIRTGVDFALSRGAWITGNLLDEVTGLAIPAFASVLFFSPSGALIASLFAQERYEKALPAGTYFMVVRDTGPNLGELYNNIPCPLSTCLATEGTPIALSAGSPITIDFILPRGGVLSGTVTDAVTGVPLGAASGSGRVCVYTATGADAGCASSDGTGHYGVAPLPTGMYYAVASDYPNHHSELYVDVTVESAGPDIIPTILASGTRIAVTAGATRTGIDFALAPQPTGSVSGTVVRTDTNGGEPATIVFYTLNGTVFRETPASIHPFLGGPATYSVHLPFGTYYVAARAGSTSNYVDELHDDIPCIGCPIPTSGGTPVSVSAAPTMVNFTLFPSGGGITGVVTDASSSAPLAGVNVEVYTRGGVLAKQVVSNVSGIYIVRGLTTGTYYARTRVDTSTHNNLDRLYGGQTPCDGCTVTLGTPIAATAGATVSGVNFALPRGGTIAGTVLAGAAPADAVVHVYDSTGAVIRSATTSPDGVFSVLALRNGDYYVRASVNGNFTNELYDNIPCVACAPTAGTPVHVLEGTTRASVDFDLSPGARITGRIIDADTRFGLSPVSVQLHRADGAFLTACLVRPAALAGQCQGDTNGTYTITGLSGGTYYVRTKAGPNYVDEVFDDIPCVDCNVTSGTPVMLPPGSTRSGVNFSLLPLTVTAAPSTTAMIAGRRVTFSLATADDERWITMEAVAGRSYCAQVTPAPMAIQGSTPVVAAFGSGGVTVLGHGAGARARACLIAPDTEALLFRTRQTDAGMRPYQFTLIETTLWANWFFIGGDYSSFTMLRNTTASSVQARITWRTDGGAIAGTATASIPPHGVVYYNARTMAPAAIAGSVEVAHNGAPQALVGSQTTLSPTSGLSFDTMLRQRRPW